MIRKVFIWTSPLPLLIFWGLWVYAKQEKGWEIFGIILLFVVPLVLSLLMTVMGPGADRSGTQKECACGQPVVQHPTGRIPIYFFMALQMMTAIDKVI